MIYLLRKHDIISVPSYAVGIYHPPKVGIISKIYHPFREERISLKTPSLYHNEGVFMVETVGIEPMTSWLPVKRSPSWATPPYLIDETIIHSNFLIVNRIYCKKGTKPSPLRVLFAKNYSALMYLATTSATFGLNASGRMKSSFNSSFETRPASAFAAASFISSASLVEYAIGFSHSTLYPLLSISSRQTSRS